MDKKFALVGIRLMVSVKPICIAAILPVCRDPQSVALFTQMSAAVHGLNRSRYFG